ncbi:hypothetical protein GBA52_025040 [Prunus armeniaca]|nr:hypothetical protein GBA52_025040 [Prunus armeniaca]
MGTTTFDWCRADWLRRNRKRKLADKPRMTRTITLLYAFYHHHHPEPFLLKKGWSRSLLACQLSGCGMQMTDHVVRRLEDAGNSE